MFLIPIVCMAGNISILLANVIFVLNKTSRPEETAMERQREIESGKVISNIEMLSI